MSDTADSGTALIVPDSALFQAINRQSWSFCLISVSINANLRPLCLIPTSLCLIVAGECKYNVVAFPFRVDSALFLDVDVKRVATGVEYK